jgi:ubiquinone/menaquinone biosynthesis C-methylase UbiE
MLTDRKDRRTLSQLTEHYNVERELSDRLRKASKEERRKLYHVVYNERLARIPHHPLLRQAVDLVERAKTVAPQLRLLRHFVKPDTVFLEIGPGDCALSMAVSKCVRQVIAVDVSEGLVQDTIRPTNFELIISDGISIPVPRNSVHLAYSKDLMEHLHPEDASEQLRNLYHVLVPAGEYICITPNRISGPWDISRHFSDEIATGFHLKEYSNKELTKVLRQAGFTKVEVFLSVAGYKLSPRLPVFLAFWVENVIEKLPRSLKKRIGQLLSVFKIIARK